MPDEIDQQMKAALSSLRNGKSHLRSVKKFDDATLGVRKNVQLFK